MLKRFEERFLDSLGSPPWEDTLANRITVWRARGAFWGSQISFWLFMLTGMKMLLAITLLSLIASAVLDLVDGQLARRTRVSAFGKFADPTADKITAFCGFLIALVYAGTTSYILLPIVVNWIYDYAVIRFRRDDPAMGANRWAKWKQAIVFVAVCCLAGAIIDVELLRGDASLHLWWIGTALLWSSLPFLLLSWLTYHLWRERLTWREWLHMQWLNVRLNLPSWGSFF